MTYKINPNAVWSDGEPITSNDFKYTWDQIVNGKDIYDTTGYDDIESVDDTDPKTAVVTFTEPFASWTQLFGADYGIYPVATSSRARTATTLMKNGYDWSGGPWIVQVGQGRRASRSTPNPNWYGTKPTIEKVIFQIHAEHRGEFQAFKGGQVDGDLPAAASRRRSPRSRTASRARSPSSRPRPATSRRCGSTTRRPRSTRWRCARRSPTRSTVTRSSSGCSATSASTKAVQTAATRRSSAQYADQEACADYTLDLDQVNSLMEGDGWAKDGDGIWAKDGKTAAFTIKSTAGNKRRELTEQILQEQLKAAGFKMTIKNPSADDLFDKVLPAGDYQVVALRADGHEPQPGPLRASPARRTSRRKANDNSGQNYQRINIAGARPAAGAGRHGLRRRRARIAASKQADQVMAEEQVSLPLDPLPNIALWSDRINGPVGDNPILSMFWNMYAWSLKG